MHTHNKAFPAHLNLPPTSDLRKGSWLLFLVGSWWKRSWPKSGSNILRSQKVSPRQSTKTSSRRKPKSFGPTADGPWPPVMLPCLLYGEFSDTMSEWTLFSQKLSSVPQSNGPHPEYSTLEPTSSENGKRKNPDLRGRNKNKGSLLSLRSEAGKGGRRENTNSTSAINSTLLPC